MTRRGRPPAVASTPVTVPRRRARFGRVVAAGASLAIVVAACGDDGNDADIDTDIETDATVDVGAAGTTGTESSASATAPSGPATTETEDTTESTGTTETTGTTGDSTETTAPSETSVPTPDGPLCAELADSGPGSRDAISDQNAATAITEIESLSTFAAAVAQSDTVTSKLEGVRPITVFAPVDSAFEQLDPATLDAVMADPAQLDELLQQHVAAGVNTSDLLGSTEGLQTQAGSQLTFSSDGGSVMINDAATVGCPDLDTSNGVIHLIDAVLLAPADTGTTPTTAGG
jgi:uncharacterized surface protein with fasciclin (FAS1) repeats